MHNQVAKLGDLVLADVETSPSEHVLNEKDGSNYYPIVPLLHKFEFVFIAHRCPHFKILCA